MKKNQKAGCAFLGGGCFVMFCIGGAVLLVLVIGISNMDAPDNSITSATAGYAYKEIYKLPGIKRTLEVYLSAKVPESRLREIAAEVKAKEDQPYEETLIGFYLPGMDTEHAAWATAHYNPDLKINVDDIMAHPVLNQ